jgi:aminopeptidase N
MIPGANTLEHVISLTKHHAFSFANPNRMRSLIGTFATSNPTGFHREDGAGYRYLSDFVLGLDKSNPQTAARILTAMRSWRSLETVRREQARQALAAIASAPSLSPDVRDIVDRILA